MFTRLSVVFATISLFALPTAVRGEPECDTVWADCMNNRGRSGLDRDGCFGQKNECLARYGKNVEKKPKKSSSFGPLGDVVRAVRSVEDVIKSAPGDVAIKIAEAVPGKADDRVVEILVNNEKFVHEMAQAPDTGVVTAVAEGNPGHLYSSALAESLEAAYKRYDAEAKPIPEAVKAALAHDFGPEVARARYVVSSLKIEFDLPAVINHFQSSSHRAGIHAVTVKDIVVFSHEPQADDIWLWAHELHHVYQYETLGGIRQFALEYLNSCDEVEGEADQRANDALDADHHPEHCLI